LARALIVGCGCRGRELGSELATLGWQIRGTSRSRATLEASEAAGFESAPADPDRPGTVLVLCRDVGVVVWLFGSAEGEPDDVSAIHGPRLERLLEKLVDSPVRGFAYEAAGTVDRRYLQAGREIVESAGRRWRIPVGLLPRLRDQPGWARESAVAVARLLAP
jgi:uncharacterized protein YbjT (DUF2867 family)